jgi:hypothetical protein
LSKLFFHTTTPHPIRGGGGDADCPHFLTFPHLTFRGEESSILGPFADLDKRPVISLAVLAGDDDEHAVRHPHFE